MLARWIFTSVVPALSEYGFYPISTMSIAGVTTLSPKSSNGTLSSSLIPMTGFIIPFTADYTQDSSGERLAFTLLSPKGLMYIACVMGCNPIWKRLYNLSTASYAHLFSSANGGHTVIRRNRCELRGIQETRIKGQSTPSPPRSVPTFGADMLDRVTPCSILRHSCLVFARQPNRHLGTSGDNVVAAR
jgi:hypothetical protein